MTAGPASRMVTLLPRNNPTPMAPPIAIMVSCRWPRRLCRPSPSDCRGSALATLSCDNLVSVMAGSTGRGNDHKTHVLLQNIHHCLHVVRGVVHMEGDTYPVMTTRSDNAIRGQLLD